ncbi:hypothetical protein LX36DRAFT_363832 [Colletotrichum falcatum]|nr:hypothetical protein LX36DRAFT_363832 [Colletotrichum falcatum]
MWNGHGTGICSIGQITSNSQHHHWVRSTYSPSPSSSPREVPLRSAFLSLLLRCSSMANAVATRIRTHARTHTTSHTSPTSFPPSRSLLPHTHTHTLKSLSEKEQQGTHQREGGRDNLGAPGSRPRLRETQGRLMNERASTASINQTRILETPINRDGERKRYVPAMSGRCG